MISKQLLMSFIEDFPDDEDVDRMRLDAALESPAWMCVMAANPRKEVDVRMTYADLGCIYRRMSYEEKRRGF